MSFKVAAVQMTSGNDKHSNLNRAEKLLLAGVNEGATLLSLPENFSFMGSESEKLLVAESMEKGESIRFLQSFARSHNVWLLGGSIPIKADEDKSFNCSLLINNKGEIAARYDKIHLFDVDIKGGESHQESRFIKKGSKPVCADTPFGKIGLSICYDLRFPELYRELLRMGARLIFAPSAFTVKTGQAHWEILLRARAIENQCYVIAPAQFGRHNNDRKTYGNTMLIDPWGEILVRAEDKEIVIVAEVDLSFQDEVRKGIPCLEHLSIK